MIKGFLTYDLAIEAYRKISELQITGSIRDQLIRASQSVVLNIAEGSGRNTKRDQARFYSIAYGSVREVMAALDLIECQDPKIRDLVDHIGACLYRLIHPRR